MITVANPRLSCTNPITGVIAPRDWGLQYLELDGVRLGRQTQLTRTRAGLVSGSVHRSPRYRSPLEWAKADGSFGFAHVRRTALLEQIAALVGTPEWTQRREA